MKDILSHILTNKVFRACVDVTEKTSTPAFIVGGYVRDFFLQRESKDIDIVVDGDGIEFAEKLIAHMGISVNLCVFKNFGTAHFEYEGAEYEFVGARKESYLPQSRNPLVEKGSVEDDQKRRDFTINAMSISLNSHNMGQFYDPFYGLDDLEKKIIKTPCNPEITFNDDPLRMLRAIRFAAQLHFKIHETALVSINRLAPRLKIVAGERIAEELNKMLLTSKPSVAFMFMKSTGVLSQILPEIHALSGVERVGKHAHKDVFLHTLEVLDNVSAVSNNLWLRWASLLHDVGKPLTKRYSTQHGWSFHGHEVVGMKITSNIFKRLKLPQNEKLDYVKKIVGLHLRPIALVEDEVSDSAIRRLLFDAGDDIDDLMLLCRADITSKNQEKVKTFLNNFDVVSHKLIEVEEKDKVRNWQPPISGETIMETFQLKPSREVGLIKNAIREAILDGHIQNNYEAAFNFMIHFAKTIKIEQKK
jgi:poly(A) polymerase